MKFSFLILVWLLSSISRSVMASPAHWTLDLPDPVSSQPSDLTPGAFAPEAGSLSWEDYFRRHPSLKKLDLGIVIGGKESLARNASELMAPASLQKIITAAAALEALGPSMRFENDFSAELDSSSGIARKVRFQVSGDPTWGNEAYEGSLESESEDLSLRLRPVLEMLKARGIKKIEGPIEVVSLRPGLSRFSRPEGWRESWSLECMAMMQTEFEANGNCGVLEVGGPSKFRWLTKGVSVPVRSRLFRSHEGVNNIRVNPVYDSRGRIVEYVLSGYFSRGPVTLALPVHQSEQWLKNIFKLLLKDAGIAFSETETQAAPVREVVRVDLSSRELIEILQQAVQYSINGVMDRVFLEIGYHFGSEEASSMVLRHFSALVGDPSLLTGTVMADGCGLDLTDRIRPDSLYRYLGNLRRTPYFNDFFSTLAVAGKSGTLLNRSTLVASSYTYGKIFAKTGTLSGVANLAGYFLREEGLEPEPFVVLTRSNLSAAAVRPMIDGVVVNFAALNTPNVDKQDKRK